MSRGARLPLLRYSLILLLTATACSRGPGTTDIEFALDPTAQRLRLYMSPLLEDPESERGALEVCLCVSSILSESWSSDRRARFRDLVDAHASAVSAWRAQPRQGEIESSEDVQRFLARLRGTPEPSIELQSELNHIGPFVVDCETQTGSQVEYLW